MPAGSKTITGYKMIHSRWDGSAWSAPAVVEVGDVFTTGTYPSGVLADKWYAYAIRTVCTDDATVETDFLMVAPVACNANDDETPPENPPTMP